MARIIMKYTYAPDKWIERIIVVDIGRDMHVQVQKLDNFDAPHFLLPSHWQI